MFDALTQHLAPWLYLPALYAAMSAATTWRPAHLAATLVLTIAGGVVAWRGWRALAPDTTASLTSWLAGLAVLFTVYAVLFKPVFFFVRYTAPLMMIVFPLLAAGMLRSVTTPRRRLAGIAVMLASFSFTAYVSLHTGQIGNSHSLSAGYIARLLPPPALVGAYQSGAVGYFNPNVVNLDGKVNSGALEAALNGTLADYARQRGLTHVVDWPGIARPPSTFQSWRDCGLGRFGYSICLMPPE